MIVLLKEGSAGHGSLDEYRSCHYGNRSLSSVPRASALTSRKLNRSRSRNFSRSPWRREKEIRPRVERQEDGPSAQHHEHRPTDENEVANFGNVNPGVVNEEQGTPSWGQKLLDYQLRSEKCLEELESLVKNRGQSKVVPKETPATPASRTTVLLRSEVNHSCEMINI